MGGWKEEKEFLEAEWRKYIEEEGAGVCAPHCAQLSKLKSRTSLLQCLGGSVH